MLAVAATAALAVASGADHAIARLPLSPTRLASAGVLLALSSVTTLDLSTVLMFDVGVYLTVWGALGGLAAHAIGLDEESA